MDIPLLIEIIEVYISGMVFFILIINASNKSISNKSNGGKSDEKI
ncbi:hypothetical protein [Clostridium pasteurianum]|nr:hypothetical protein [Clostridium pasteurianum]